jgi:gliding motility-associated-like protein
MKYIVYLFLFSIRFTAAQCPQITKASLNKDTIDINFCKNDSFKLFALGNVTGGLDSVLWYFNTTPTFNPYLGQGTQLGASKIITNSYTPCVTCPRLSAIFINSCNGSGDEWDNEFAIIYSGSGFKANTLQLDYDINNNGMTGNNDININTSPCGLKTPNTALMNMVRATASCNLSNVIAVKSTDTIPADAIVVLFNSSAVTGTYNFSSLCNVGKKIYVMQSNCARTGGAYTNSASCTNSNRYSDTKLSFTNCACKDSIVYDRCGLSDVDGEYAINLSPTKSTKTNGGVLRNISNPCDGPVPSTLSFPIKGIIDSTPISNLSRFCGLGTIYVKGIFKNHPNTAFCPNTDPKAISNILKFHVTCPKAIISGDTNICFNGSSILTGSGGGTYIWSTGQTTNPITVNKDSIYKLIVTVNGCKDTVAYKVHASTTPKKDTLTFSACTSYSYKSKSYNTTTSFPDTVFTKGSALICDSIYHLVNIIIQTKISNTLNKCILSGQSYFFKGINRTTAGQYIDTISIGACDSIVILNLQVIAPMSKTIDTAGCMTLFLLGKTFSTNTILKDTLRSINGCDSIYTQYNISIINAMINPAQTLTGCGSYIYKSINYTASTTVNEVIKSKVLTTCDSIINTINIVILGPQTITPFNLFGCNSVTYKSVVYTANTTIFDTIKFKQYPTCDSIIAPININLSIGNIGSSINVYGCGSYTFNVISFTNDTILGDTVKSTVTGCDSIYNVTYIKIYKTTTLAPLTLSGCGSYTYKGITYTTNISIKDTIRYTQIASCDSLIQPYKIVIVKPTVIPAQTKYGCGSYTYKGNVYTTNQTFSDTIKSKINTGCDSLIYPLNIVILNSTTLPNLVLSDCNFVIYNGTQYNTSQNINNTIKYKNGSNCDSIIQPLSITILPNPTDTIHTQPGNVICLYDSTALSTSGGASYIWSNGSSDASIKISPSMNTTYSVTVTGANGCKAVNYKYIIVKNNKVSITSDYTNPAHPNQAITVQATAIYPSLYSWTPKDLFTNPTDFKNVINLTKDSMIVVQSTDLINGCIGYDTLYIVIKEEDILIPNVFSPNGDNLNDVFRLKVLGNVEVTLFEIYNRWGEKIYQSTSKDTPGWDGKYKGSDQPIGTFIYFINYVKYDKKEFVKGNLTLIR